jgi:hypothetical protein
MSGACPEALASVETPGENPHIYIRMSVAVFKSVGDHVKTDLAELGLIDAMNSLL